MGVRAPASPPSDEGVSASPAPRRWRRVACLALGITGVGIAGVGIAPRAVWGQVPGGIQSGVISSRVPLTPAQRARVDSLRRDSVARARAGRDTSSREIVQWLEPDSVEAALELREGYRATRYQGANAVFDATTHNLTLQGSGTFRDTIARAAVKRDQTILVGDTIVYDDSLDVITARGDSVTLRDPAHNQDDILSIGYIRYDIATREALTTNVNTVFPAGGNRWFIDAARAAYVGDTARVEIVEPDEDTTRAGPSSTFYGLDGLLTTCDDTFPHYHFQVGEIKFITRHVLVARPAVLYIGDVPVMWFPFLFQDLRRGRHSGILTPRFGLSELLRNSPNYRRHVENIGYYFDINDYTDATTWIDWRSSARPQLGDPGWTRYNGEFRYRWLNRFVSGSFAMSYQSLSDGETNTAISWQHQQDFSQSAHLNMNINYETSTTVQQTTYYNPYSVLAVISSQLNFQDQLGPAAISLGGSQKQYPGRTEIDRNFPTLSISTKPVSAGSWLVWTPTLSVDNSENLKVDQFGNFAERYVPNDTGGIDSTRLQRNQRNTTASFSTPITIFGFNWQNSITYSDQFNNFPEQDIVYLPARVNGRDTALATTRIFSETYRTALDWNTSLALPRLLQGSWNVVPSVAIENADAGAPFLVRTQFTGTDFLQQTKRFLYGVSISPTFYGFFPGIAGIARIRHSLTPVLSFSYSPAASVDTAFLKANGQSPVGYLGGLAQQVATLSLSQTIEAKLKVSPDADSETTPAPKLKLLSLTFDPLSYDFERARFTHRALSGFTTSSWGYSVRTDLLPGFDFRETYSLFQGDPSSDSAVFKPYWQGISATFSINRKTNLFSGIAQVLGLSHPAATPDTATGGRDPFLQQQVAAQRVAGSEAALAQYSAPTLPGGGQGWQASFTFSATRTRPPVGNLADAYQFDPSALCNQFLVSNPLAYNLCVAQQKTAPADTNINATTSAAPYVFVPAQTTLQGSIGFNITPKWTAQWQTTYDFRAHDFASQIITLQRDLHDWHLVLAFTQSPTGSFAFTFFVSLKAEPALKFNYDKQTYHTPNGTSIVPTY
jgi:hypothetical protein